MRIIFSALAAGLVALCPPAAFAAKVPPPKEESGQSFTRLVHPSASTEALETRAERLVPTSGNGPVIWLVSTAHIGEGAYYKAIQKILDAQSLVLYEGVKKDEPPAATPKEGASAQKKPFPNRGKSTYLEFAKAVGLEFQLDDIDYDRKTFKNCDLTWDEVTKLSAKQGKATQDTVNTVGHLLDAGSPQAKMLESLLDEIRKDPGERAAMRVFLAEFLAQPGSMDKILGTATTDVLIHQRNSKVLNELHNQAAETSIAIFFGAGHMPDMERRLIAEHHYRPAESVWLQAITAEPSKVTGQGTFMLAGLRALLTQPKQK